MEDTLLVEVIIPLAAKRYDMEVALFAHASSLIEECLRWVCEQNDLPMQEGKHYLCNARTAEVLEGDMRLCDSAVIRGDQLVIF